MTDLSRGFDALGQTDTDQHPGQQQAASQLPFDPSQGVDPLSNVKHALTGERNTQEDRLISIVTTRCSIILLLIMSHCFCDYSSSSPKNDNIVTAQNYNKTTGHKP